MAIYGTRSSIDVDKTRKLQAVENKWLIITCPGPWLIMGKKLHWIGEFEEDTTNNIYLFRQQQFRVLLR